MSDNFFWDNPQPENGPAPEPEVPEMQQTPAEEPATEPEQAPAEETPVEETPAEEAPQPANDWQQAGAQSGPVWYNESTSPEPPKSEEKAAKKRRGGTRPVIVLAILLALAVGVTALFATDLVAIRLQDGLQVYVGPNASARANSGLPDKDEDPVESFMDLEDTPDRSEEEPGENGELSIRQIAKKVKPSVVGIVCKVQSGRSIGESSGSGIVLSEDGYIVTNAHVISGGVSISVVTDDGKTFSATTVGSDEDSDIAVLKINATGLTPASFATSSTAEVGDTVVAIGSPYGLELQGTVTAGIVSAVDRNIVVDENNFTLIQTDAAINSGNSGGPLINAYGQVIGINSLKLSDSYADGLGFAIPTDVFKPIVDELVAKGYISGKPALGVMGQIITEEYTYYYGLPTGFYITEFRSREPIIAGLQVGDIITEMDGQKFASMAELNAIKDKFKAGDTVEITVYRDENYYDDVEGRTLKLKIKLGDEQEIQRSEAARDSMQ